jgi:predicted membrane protein
MDQDKDFKTMTNEINSFSFKQLAIFCAFAFFPFALAIYLIYLIYQTCKNYLSIKFSFKEMLANKFVNPLMNSSNDDEYYKSPKEQEDLLEYDTYIYDKINQNIKNIVSDPDTVSYNKNQTLIWNTIYDKDPIDIIDRNALLKENDNW